MSERYDPYKPAYGPGSNSDHQAAAEWEAIQKDVYGDDEAGGDGGGGGTGCSGLIFIGIIVLAVMSVVESGLKSLRKDRGYGAIPPPEETRAPAQVHYLAMTPPPFDWPKLIDHRLSERLTTVTVENHRTTPLRIYSFSGHSMIKHAEVQPSSRVSFTCEVDRVLGIGDEAGNLQGVVRAENRSGVLALW